MVAMKLAVFADQIKSAVSCRQLLEANGTTVGRHGFAVCPLHGDKDASLKVYDNGRGWCCYGCHKGGDVINLAMALYDVRFNDAVRRLNDEFKIGLDLGGKASEKDAFIFKAKYLKEKYARLDQEQKARKAEKTYLDWLELYLVTNELLLEYEPGVDDEWSDEFAHFIEMRQEAKRMAEGTYWEWVAYG